MEEKKFQPGDLVRFHSHVPRLVNLNRVGVVIESRSITHAERGHIYDVVTVQFGDQRFDYPSVDFALIKRVQDEKNIKTSVD